ncbi:MAG: DivIVA domain-containing protein [Coriobacteriia bacterium]|nr:DivIVA domain-containing protein [Coriobacteriia bacterium]
MTEKIAFQIQSEGYSPLEVDAFVNLLIENYEELLTHYQTQQAELTQVTGELAQINKELDEYREAPSAAEHNAEALELLNEATKVVAETKKQARTKITALIDQASLHAYRLEDTTKSMKDELDKMYSVLEDQL